MDYRLRLFGIGVPLALAILVMPASGQDLAQFEGSVREFMLDNGLKLLVLRRGQAPVVSCLTHVDVGAADEVVGITGVAHLLEHMAFKGTQTIGTTDYQAERECMAEVDARFRSLRQAERTLEGEGGELRRCRHAFDVARSEAQSLAVSHEMERILKRAGARSLNAGTDCDATVYHVCLPSNKLELWMLLESERFRIPVFREFYAEREVVMEERRVRVENHPHGLLGEEFLAVAYKAHPYGQPVVGHMSDLQSVTRAQVRAFFDEHYVASNMTVAIVGDVDPCVVHEMAKRYFGRLPRRPDPLPVETLERRVDVTGSAQPLLFGGYHIPSIRHPDYAILDVISDLMGVGRSSRLYTALVAGSGVAVTASTVNGRPGNKYPGLFVFYAVPAARHTSEECEREIYGEIERLKTEPVPEEELRKITKRVRVRFVRKLNSNMGLARRLAFHEVVAGDWRHLFRRLERLQEANPEDVRRVAQTYFSTENRVVGVLRTKGSDEQARLGGKHDDP